jgi:hypothetical protein
MHQPTGGNFQFVASDAPMDIENYLDRINTLISEEPILYLNNTINSSLDILLTLTLDEHTARAVAKGGHIITDNLNYFATRSNSKGIGLSLQDATLFLQPYDVLLNEDSRFLDKLTDDQVLHLVKKMLFLFMRDRAVLLQQELVKTRADIADLAASLIYFFDKKETQARQTAQKVLNRDPSNELARYMTMRNSIHIVAAGMAHKSLLSNAQEATGELRLLIDGWKSAVEEDWATVAGIDVQLGRIPVTRPWYAETMHLRAEWRARAAAVQPDLARDAALMVELALAQQPSEGLHSLRAYIASGLDDHDTMFSSFRSSGSFILNRIVGAEQGIAPLQDSERQDMIGRIDATLQALNLDIPVNQDPRAHYLRDSFQALRQSALAAP